MVNEKNPILNRVTIGQPPAYASSDINPPETLAGAGNESGESVDRGGVQADSRHHVQSASESGAPAAGIASNRPLFKAPGRLFLVVLLSCAALFLIITGVAVFPQLAGNRTLTIMTGSMEPIVHVGSAAIVKPVPSQNLRVGDIIAFVPGPGALTIVHRIVDIKVKDGVRYFTTRGDANPTQDANELTLPPTAWVLWYSLPWVGYLMSFGSSTLGFTLLIVAPGMLLLGLSAIDGIKKIRLVFAHSRSS
jgi:signal peptidase I